MPAAKSLAVMLLKKMDNCFYRQRRAMEDGFSLPHGTFVESKTTIFPRTSS